MANEEDRWEWKIGTLQGIGESAWQQRGNKIRRMTVLTGITQTGAVMFAKAICLMAMGDTNGLREFDAEGFVIISSEPKAGFDKDFQRLWGSNLVIPGARS